MTARRGDIWLNRRGNLQPSILSSMFNVVPISNEIGCLHVFAWGDRGAGSSAKRSCAGGRFGRRWRVDEGHRAAQGRSRRDRVPLLVEVYAVRTGVGRR